MDIWLNGTFGVGKTTLARHLIELLPEYRLFDPEFVGFLLRASLPDHPRSDFQHLPPWRALVPTVAGEVARFTGQRLVAVQTVLIEQYWNELLDGLANAGLPVMHVVLHADAATLHHRIDTDPHGADIRSWRHDHVDEYLEAAAGWLHQRADLVVDATAMPPDQVARQVAAHVAEHAIES